jgi:Ca2+-transporting ATPase
MAGQFFDDSVAEVSAALQSDPRVGISDAEAKSRLAQLGPNVIAGEEGPSRLDILKGQLLSPVVGVLLVAAVLTVLLREWVDFGVILAIVVLNAVVGYLQEYRAEKSLQMLRQLAAPKARVVRGGRAHAVASADLVPGDLLELEAGDLVPADARVVFEASLKSNESALTGESLPVDKTTEPSLDTNAPLGDRSSCVYLGTSLAGGRGRAIVFGTGPDSELGKIVKLVRGSEREPTTLQRDLSQVGKVLLVVCGVAIAAVFVMGVVRGFVGLGERISAADMFLTAVSLAVAAIPEGLPAIVTITLAIGVQRMLKRHVLLRRLASVETLGCASVICADKTGTLTLNELAVRDVVLPDGVRLDLERAPSDEPARFAATKDLLSAAAACSNVRRDGGGHDPTEVALAAAARRVGLDFAALDAALPRLAEAPFDSERRRMSTLHADRGGKVLFVKGAHEVVLERSTSAAGAGESVKLDSGRRQSLEALAEALAGEGKRVLAVARRELRGSVNGEADPSALETDLCFLGFVAMADAPRPEARAAVDECRDAGIRTVLLTGDHARTARSIAADVGVYRNGDMVLTGADVAGMSEDQLTQVVDRVSVYARLAPEQKLHIVRAWKRRGAVVAMTGDGVNDAPAIKEADIGVAMGKSGTDVAREAADLVITDDNFASIVAGVEEGRGIYANIRRALLCLFAGNLSEVAVVGAATSLGLPVPLHPTQILWMNLVTDGPPALALATEPVSLDEMRRPPRDRRSRLLDKATIIHVVYQGFALYLGAMLALLYFFDGGAGPRALAEQRMQTGVFCTVVLSQMLNCFSFRSDIQSVFRIGIRGNLRLFVAIAVSIALQVLIVQWTRVAPVFHTQALTLEDWRAVVLFSFIPIGLVEIRKAWMRSRG